MYTMTGKQVNENTRRRLSESNGITGAISVCICKDLFDICNNLNYLFEKYDIQILTKIRIISKALMIIIHCIFINRRQNEAIRYNKYI